MHMQKRIILTVTSQEILHKEEPRAALSIHIASLTKLQRYKIIINYIPQEMMWDYGSPVSWPLF